MHYDIYFLVRSKYFQGMTNYSYEVVFILDIYDVSNFQKALINYGKKSMWPTCTLLEHMCLFLWK